MATFLDVSLLGQFIGIFTFILVFVIVYGMLEIFKIFGDEKRGLHALIAFCIGILVLLTRSVVTVITTFAPYFTILIILIFFILFAVRMFGVSQKDITNEFQNSSTIITVLLILTVTIFLFSLGNAFGQESLESTQGGKVVNQTTVLANGTIVTGTQTNTGSFNENLYNTIFHPKILGMVLILLIVVFAMLLITTRPSA